MERMRRGFSYLHEGYWSHRKLHASEMWQRYSPEAMLANEPLQCMIGRGSQVLPSKRQALKEKERPFVYICMAISSFHPTEGLYCSNSSSLRCSRDIAREQFLKLERNWPLLATVAGALK